MTLSIRFYFCFSVIKKTYNLLYEMYDFLFIPDQVFETAVLLSFNKRNTYIFRCASILQYIS